MMGLAIAHHIREQVSFDEEEIRVSPQYHFNIEKAHEPINELGEITIV